MKSKSPKKPTITRREASRLVAEAGAAAYERAGSSAGDPKALAALMNVDRVDIVAGLKVRPLLLHTFLVLERLWSTDWHQTAPETLKQAMTVFAYVHPAEADSLIAKGDKTFVEHTRAWSSTITGAEFNDVAKLALQHVADFYGASSNPDDKPKKKDRPARSKSGQGT